MRLAAALLACLEAEQLLYRECFKFGMDSISQNANMWRGKRSADQSGETDEDGDKWEDPRPMWGKEDEPMTLGRRKGSEERVIT